MVHHDKQKLTLNIWQGAKHSQMSRSSTFEWPEETIFLEEAKIELPLDLLLFMSTSRVGKKLRSISRSSVWHQIDRSLLPNPEVSQPWQLSILHCDVSGSRNINLIFLCTTLTIGYIRSHWSHYLPALTTSSNNVHPFDYQSLRSSSTKWYSTKQTTTGAKTSTASIVVRRGLSLT